MSKRSNLKPALEPIFGFREKRRAPPRKHYKGALNPFLSIASEWLSEYSTKHGERKRKYIDEALKTPMWAFDVRLTIIDDSKPSVEG